MARRYVWRLLVEYPDEPPKRPENWLECGCTNPDCDNHDGLARWPKERMFLSKHSAERKASILREMGATAHVQRSLPVEFPPEAEIFVPDLIELKGELEHA